MLHSFSTFLEAQPTIAGGFVQDQTLMFAQGLAEGAAG
jgi:hypothetical protein